ncbi:MAG: HlyC/CorC family transporter, partial [Clostridia bacterium]|nr:HlyC/CorC family transporter [Clostridia bacterium]
MGHDGSPTSLLIAILVLVVLSAFFSATETAYTSLNTIKLKSLAIKDKRYQKVLNLYERYDKLITTILIGNNIVNLTASSLALLFFQQILSGNVNLDASLISTAVITIVVLIFGEITPKFISKAYPEKVALLNYHLINLCYYLFYPLNLVLIGYKWVINAICKLDREDTITDDELITIVNEAEEDGTLKEEESVLIKSAIEFDDLEVKDILIPRINVVAIPETATVSEIKSVFENERYSRVPVYSGNIDSVIGFIHEKDFYRSFEKPNFSIKSIMQEVVNVVEHTKISVLLKKLQVKKIHMAVVLDEYGGTLGIVTMEDIIEELVGEIYDEYDEESTEIRQTEDGTYRVNGSANLDDFFEFFDLVIDGDEFDANTVGGW